MTVDRHSCVLVAFQGLVYWSLHRPIEGGSKVDSKIPVGVYLLHTCLFNLERCNGYREGLEMIMYFHFPPLNFKVIVRPYRVCQYPFVTDGNLLLSK